jgi:hypothetical protein
MAKRRISFWSIGVLEYWSTGVLEYWDEEVTNNFFGENIFLTNLLAYVFIQNDPC